MHYYLAQKDVLRIFGSVNRKERRLVSGIGLYAVPGGVVAGTDNPVENVVAFVNHATVKVSGSFPAVDACVYRGPVVTKGEVGSIK